MNCLGSAVAIREHSGIIYVDTHYNPSAGCVIILSPKLAVRAALSGSLLGVLGADYALLRRSEVHFMAVHPLHIAVIDLQRNRSMEVYPFADDPQRREYSQLIGAHISEKWCRQHDAPCDPQNFDTNLESGVTANEAAKVFAVEARFDAAGFGDAAEKYAAQRMVDYVFRAREGRAWEHREFQSTEIRSLFGEANVVELVANHPLAAFEVDRWK
jgi:hypothetical protein